MANFGGMGNLFKQAQEMQAKLARTQEELARRTVEAAAGGGMVQVTVTGQLALASIKIDPSVVNPEDVEMLQDLVLAATNEGLRLAREMAAEEMSKITGGMKIPGFTP
jgi:DNA-binding YbaB/EbfC family protein